MPQDELEPIVDRIFEHRLAVSDAFVQAANDAMAEYVNDIKSTVREIDSEAELEEHIKTVKKFSKKANMDADQTEQAVKTIRGPQSGK